MKSLVIALALCCSLMFVKAAPAGQTEEEKENQYMQECNVTNPVQRNPLYVMAAGISAGDLYTLSHEEQCYLFCFLKKIKLLNEDGNIRNGTSVIKYAIKESPEMALYSDTLIVELFQIQRSSKGYQDKCVKAQIIYHRLAEQFFVMQMANFLERSTGVKGKIVHAVEDGQSVHPDIAQHVKEYLTFFDMMTRQYAKEVKEPYQESRIAI